MPPDREERDRGLLKWRRRSEVDSLTWPGGWTKSATGGRLV
jgi:hypothetical protein